MREQDLGHYDALICLPEPSTLFNTSEPTLKEIKEVIKSARTASAPGPSGVPYKVYKQWSVFGRYPSAMEVRRGCMDSQGGELKEHRAVQDNFAP